MPMHYQLFEDYKKHEAALNIFDAASRIKVPFLICHGSEDTSVNMQSAHEIHKANETSELLIVASDHIFGRKHPWVESHLPNETQQVVDANIIFFKRAFYL